jgi:hypothetical protein
MPKIKVNLTVEFETDKPDYNVDVALDQVLFLQPSCKIISKTLTEIDGIPYFGDVIFSRNGFHEKSYRPDYSGHERDQGRIDSYRPGPSVDHVPSSRSVIDSYRPEDRASSDAVRGNADRQNETNPSKYTENSTSGVLDTRYGPLIADMIVSPDPQSSRTGKIRGRHPEHYSPPPRRDRSASPPRAVRRSDRLRSAPSSKEVVWPPRREPRDPMSDVRRKLAAYEEEMKLPDAEPGSLEALAAKSALNASIRPDSRFERQRECKYTTVRSPFPNRSLCNRSFLVLV